MDWIKADRALSITASFLSIGSGVLGLLFWMFAPATPDTAAREVVGAIGNEQPNDNQPQPYIDKAHKAWGYWQMINIIFVVVGCIVIAVLCYVIPAMGLPTNIKGVYATDTDGTTCSCCMLGCLGVAFSIPPLVSSGTFLAVVLCLAVLEDGIGFSKGFILRSFFLAVLFFLEIIVITKALARE